MLWILLAFGLWCVIIGLLVRWELNKRIKITTIVSFESFTGAINQLIVSFEGLIGPTKAAQESIKTFGEAWEKVGDNVS